MERKDQLYVLNWMLNFAKADIDKLQDEQLLMELDAALSGHLGDSGMRIAVPFVLWRVRSARESPETFVLEKIRQARRLQRYLKTYLQEFLKLIDKARGSEGKWLVSGEFEELMRVPGITVEEATFDAVIRAEQDYLDEEGFDDTPLQICWPPGSLNNGVFKMVRRLPNDEHALVIHFLEAIDGLPLKSIQECSECKRWFVSPDERTRTYCSPECGRKKRNREYWAKKKADPQKHKIKLAEKRDKEHERYDKMKKSKGYNKTDRRPHKKYRKES